MLRDHCIEIRARGSSVLKVPSLNSDEVAGCLFAHELSISRMGKT